MKDPPGRGRLPYPLARETRSQKLTDPWDAMQRTPTCSRVFRKCVYDAKAYSKKSAESQDVLLFPSFAQGGLRRAAPLTYLQAGPVPAVRGSDTPHVVLQQALRRGRPLVCLVRPKLLRKLTHSQVHGITIHRVRERCDSRDENFRPMSACCCKNIAL